MAHKEWTLDEGDRPITKWTVKAFTRQILAELDETYDLVFVDYDDKFTAEQTAMIMRGDWEALWESTEEWESEQRFYHVKEAAEQLARDIAQRWERTFGVDSDMLYDEWDTDVEAFDEVRFAIEERDSSNWVQELARHTPDVLMRHVWRGEDAAWSYQAITPTEVITSLVEECPGSVVKRNKHNLGVARAVLNEANPEFGYVMGMLVYAISVSDLLALPGYTEHVDIVNPHLYLGNYYQGDGYCDGPLSGTVRVKVSDLRTDRDAPGYGWDEVAGVYTKAYETEIIAVTPNPQFEPVEGATFLGGWEHFSVSTEGIKSLGTYELWVTPGDTEGTTTLTTRTPAGDTEQHSVTEVRAAIKGPAPWSLEWRVITDRYDNWKKANR